MAHASIPVDIFNPGQVFACLGFLEAADILLGNALGGFDWTEEVNIRFHLETNGKEDPVIEVLDFLASADVVALSPLGSDRIGQSDVEAATCSNGVFPVSPRVSEGTKRIWIKESALPILLISDHGQPMSVSYWADVDNGRESVKTWGGAQGKSGAIRMSELLRAAGEQIRSDAHLIYADPFNASLAVSGLRLEMRRDYVPIDIGFSLNNHKSDMKATGFPLVEILAALGFENGRPKVLDRLHYRYAAWRGLLSPSLARPTIGCSSVGCQTRTFIAVLGEPNDYDRSILFAREEHLA